jgi:lipopolysaccharide transport system ATP-binding protein
MSSDVSAIHLSGIGKAFEIYEKPHHRLLAALAPRAARVIPRMDQRWQRERFSRQYWALRDVHLDVKKGDAVGIIGRNGSGKSTLLQIIAGTLAPTTGECRVKGRVAALLELGSGFNPDFSGRENVFLNGLILGLTEREIRERFDDIAAFADIGDFLDQPVRTYSSGMMLRLAFAVQTQVNPEILIVDEALAVGDALFQKRCFQQMEALRANGCTLLLVSHDQESIRTLTDHAILLRDGIVRSRGPSSEVVLDYRRDLHEDEKRYYAGITAAHAQFASDSNDAQHQITADTRSFGDLDCVIEGVRVLDGRGDECAYFLPGDRVLIEVACVPRSGMDKLNVNVRLRNKEGVKLYSWGTLNQDIAASACGDSNLVWSRVFAGGERFVVTFEFECTLGMNFYEIQASVSEELDFFQGSQRMLHWRDEAAFFQVGMRQREYAFGGVADLRMKAHVG